MTRTSIWLGAVSLCALSALAATPASAQSTQTAAGSSITNTVSMNYQVGGVTQTTQTASDTFTVDRKVNLTVAELGTTTTQVSPGQTAVVTTFQVTNTSNATLDFALVVTQQAGGAGAHANTDTFDVSNVRIFVDTNGNGVYDAGTDTQVTYLDEIAADTTRTVFVLADVPLGRATGDVAAVTLTATGREGGAAGATGAALVQTAGANTSGMDTVFADGAGSTDASRDASYSAKDDYTVLAAALTLTKVSRIVSDPFNGTTNPKMIPGSVVEYCIAVRNAAGGASATNVALSDVLPTTTTYSSAYGILLNGTMTGSTCNLDGASGGSYGSGTVSGTLPSLTAGDARTLVFRVTVN
ncbi:hypothetical protein M0208_12510 [Sphingomonas sp. SUN019]|uniref:hypothetical protein n=1 Tax=Sphingomonas sp. SUN019 TaxID=2937788 RepID=UPI002164D6BB|nr:hypothetical protein [Sphingomonas sp. SUN019]UVO51292.1 hypothetical protein M0208_12510 [Sphingomonas sp. SUN019]